MVEYWQLLDSLQVIDDSMKSFKAFFRWLYVEILRLSDEDVSGILTIRVFI